MRVYYKGKLPIFKHRLAEIEFDEDTEEKAYYVVQKLMYEKGWKDLRRVTNDYAACEVEDYNEYKMFVQDYKQCKRAAKSLIKQGVVK